MARQQELFPKPKEVISVNDSRREPWIWVRRLVICATPSEILRDIHLRRGLNVIWSRDPGSEAAILGWNSESGHGAGKTLFCRLLRYCLGEETFAPDEARKNIAAKFPNGLVGAELIICGSLWAVVRPIGHTRRHLIRQHATVEQLLESKEPASGIKELLDACNAMLHGANLASVVPELHGSPPWLFALAWLARDQEYRFDHILDWRHPRSESGSPASQISKDQKLPGVRALLGILDDEEVRLRNERNSIPARRQSKERNLAYSRRRLDELGTELLKQIGIDRENAFAGTLDLGTLRATADERVRAENAKFSNRPFAAEITAVRLQRDGIVQQSAVLQSEIERLQAKTNFVNEEMKALRGERANLSAEEIRAALGDFCPVCRVPIDTALAEGCALALQSRSAESIQNERAELAARFQACNQAIARYQGDASEKKLLLADVRRREHELNVKIVDLESQAEKQRQDQRQEWADARRFQEQVAEFAELEIEVSRAQQEVLAFDRRDQELKDEESVLRDRHSNVLRRLDELFAFVCKRPSGERSPFLH
jgi:hypothetical protein